MLVDLITQATESCDKECEFKGGKWNGRGNSIQRFQNNKKIGPDVRAAAGQSPDGGTEQLI
jgi:hypothetical protein